VKVNLKELDESIGALFPLHSDSTTSALALAKVTEEVLVGANSETFPDVDGSQSAIVPPWLVDSARYATPMPLGQFANGAVSDPDKTVTVEPTGNVVLPMT
jgi:hypothetical protein